MALDRREIAESFDARAAAYARSDWHRRAAERLVELCGPRPESHVLDACTGTGFAALAAAGAVGRGGHVRGVDISPGMLREARAAVTASGLSNVELIEGDATRLPQFADGAFDAITCACGLLYIGIGETDAALREWHRLLKPGGRVAVSAMQAGCPPGARIFRSCAAAFGVPLPDPCEPLGSVAACRAALETAAFAAVRIVSEPIELSADDLSAAWDSNVRAASHADVRRLSEQDQQALKSAYLAALDREEHEHPGAIRRSEIIYAVGRRTASMPRR